MFEELAQCARRMRLGVILRLQRQGDIWRRGSLLAAVDEHCPTGRQGIEPGSQAERVTGAADCAVRADSFQFVEIGCVIQQIKVFIRIGEGRLGVDQLVAGIRVRAAIDDPVIDTRQQRQPKQVLPNASHAVQLVGGVDFIIQRAEHILLRRNLRAVILAAVICIRVQRVGAAGILYL